MMKKSILIIISGIILYACSPSSEEDRYTYEDGAITDTETGDIYKMEKHDTLTIVHIDGTSEEIVVTDAPFYGSEEAEKFINAEEERIKAREQALLKEKKAMIKEERKQRYAEFDDEELMDEFSRLHKEGAPFAHQMDVIIELVDRKAIGKEEAPALLEVDTSKLDFEIEYSPSENP